MLGETRSIIGKWLDIMHKSSSPDFNTKDLMLDPGFLIYTTPTYATMVPYLKGMNLTIYLWRKNRDDDGWKVAT